MKDSKELSQKKREELFENIKKREYNFITIKTSAKELDKEMDEKNLNEIEIENIAKIIDSFESKKPKVFVDAIEANTLKFKLKLLSKINDKEIEIIAENKADSTYPIVSAASIIAKVTRDNEIKNLHKRYCFFGSGYPSDERTIKFLEKLDRKNYNKIVRLKWATSKNILKKKKQKNLFSFE